MTQWARGVRGRKWLSEPGMSGAGSGSVGQGCQEQEVAQWARGVRGRKWLSGPGVSGAGSGSVGQGC